jgi:hypothetical protein
MPTPEKLAERREKMRLYMIERRKNPVYAAKNRADVKKWQAANREKAKQLTREWRAANPEKNKASQIAWRRRQGAKALSVRDKEAYRRYRRAHHINKKFGLSTEQYDAMLAAQGGHCAQCPWPDKPYKRLAVDHDHKTGRIRGLLCADCNRGIGLFGDDPARLRAAADYLDRHNLTPDELLA